MFIVLFEPEIPQNTGNIIRLCANLGCGLILIEPLGFEISDKQLKRAGLDYHAQVITEVCTSWAHFCSRYSPQSLWALSTKSQRSYVDACFQKDDFLLFGPESRGLPKEILGSILEKNRGLRIPMHPHARSLNLANSVGIVAYEAYRQIGFPGLV